MISSLPIMQPRNLSDLIHHVEVEVSEHVANLVEQDPDVSIDHINLYLPCTFFMLRSIR